MASPASATDDPAVLPSSGDADRRMPFDSSELRPAVDPDALLGSTDFFGAGRNAVGDHATDEDSLGFAPYVEAIAAFLTSPATDPPLTISIEGEWGSGKSSFMLQLEKAISGPSRRSVFFKELPTALGGYTTPGSLWKAIQSARQLKPQLPVIRFNAWRHDKQDALWAAFALSVAHRLRERVGFRRAWLGDFRLFLQRLRGIRGLLEFALLLVSVFLFASSAGLLIYHAMNLGLSASIHAFSQLAPGEKAKKLDDIYSEIFSKTAATHFSMGGFFLIALAGFLKFKDQIKLPIAINLKKYLATPDYDGHAAFIECFHEDFARLLRAYAGSERVFIFIDDLDRCDVPRAAELMQAINLMIADAGRLVFVLGMDREKVAAGITQKYKDLLPFLPEYTAGLSTGTLTGAGSSPLSFGYSYLEKFIQLSFTLPVIGGPDALEKFLDAMLPRESRPTWKRQLTYYWTPRLAWNARLSRWWKSAFGEPTEPKPPRVSDPYPSNASFPTFSASAPEAVQTESRVQRIRIQIAEDSKGIRDLVTMVSPMFDNNPRRLKQFVSTFRLSLALSSDQGILGRGAERSSVTPQQLGKFVALTMRFPDLRVALTEDSDLLGKLESASRTWPPEAQPQQQYWRWLRRKAVQKVLLYGVREVIQTTGTISETRVNETASPYSLQDLDVRRLLSLLPKIPLSSETSPGNSVPSSDSMRESHATDSSPEAAAVGSDPTAEDVQQHLDLLAHQYVQSRVSMPASNTRTRMMTDLVHEVQSHIAEFTPQSIQDILAEQLNKTGDGNRIVALAIACERADPGNLVWLLDYLWDFRSPFEHYWTIRALLLHESYITYDIAAHIENSLLTHMKEIAEDAGRVNEAQRLLTLVHARMAFPPSA